MVDQHRREPRPFLRAVLEELGELDNTVIIFTSDNGASREGGSTGTTSTSAAWRGSAFHQPGAMRTRVAGRTTPRIDLLGGPRW